MSLRRQFELPEEDIHFLENYGCSWETIKDQSLWVLLHNFSTQREGYNHKTVLAAIRIEPGYPGAALDMVYFHPSLERLDGQQIKQTQAQQIIDGKSFQRWSRHYTPANPYDKSEPNLGSHILTIEDWLIREFEK
jgi:hypothetical protein